MKEPAAMLSAKEERFEDGRRRVGLFAGPIVFLLLWVWPLSGLNEPAHRLLAVFGLVVTFWITEAIPLPVTALLAPTLCVVCGISSEKETFRSFGNPIIFLFLGSFLLAEAMFHHGLNRRIAFRILGLHWVGQSPARILGAFGAITGFLSMWISNTTATAMMFPIGVAILSEMARQQSVSTGKTVKFTDLKFGTGLMLTAAFASSIGGLGTPVGTPPNLIGIGQIEKAQGIHIGFFQWMGMGLPLVIVMLVSLIFYLNRVCPAGRDMLGQSTAWIHAEAAQLGPLTRGERNVLVAFGFTITLWLLPGFSALLAGSDSPYTRWLNAHLPEGVSALLGATLLFLLPVNWRARQFTVSWKEATRIDWGTILLFGGGLALGDAMFSSGLAKWMGEGLAQAFNTQSTLGLIVLFTVMAVVLTETTSNTATANMLVPVAIAVAQAARVSPIQPAIAVCLGASLAFMLPVSTPPNAIVFGSGCVPLLRMLRYGLVLDLVGTVAIIVIVYWLVPLVIR